MNHRPDTNPRDPPYLCEVGEHEFVEGRIPDEFSISVSGSHHKTKMVLVERYVESPDANEEREKQVAHDRNSNMFKVLSVEYDGNCSVVTASIEGTRPEITEALFRELTIHAKFFLGDEKTDAIYDDIIVEVAE